MKHEHYGDFSVADTATDWLPTDRGSLFAPIGAAGNDPLPPTPVDTSQVFESFTDS
jgi:hypothetical protein